MWSICCPTGGVEHWDLDLGSWLLPGGLVECPLELERFDPGIHPLGCDLLFSHFSGQVSDSLFDHEQLIENIAERRLRRLLKKISLMNGWSGTRFGADV